MEASDEENRIDLYYRDPGGHRNGIAISDNATGKLVEDHRLLGHRSALLLAVIPVVHPDTDHLVWLGDGSQKTEFGRRNRRQFGKIESDEYDRKPGRTLKKYLTSFRFVELPARSHLFTLSAASSPFSRNSNICLIPNSSDKSTTLPPSLSSTPNLKPFPQSN